METDRGFSCLLALFTRVNLRFLVVRIQGSRQKCRGLENCGRKDDRDIKASEGWSCV